jgi:predicted permease
VAALAVLLVGLLAGITVRRGGHAPEGSQRVLEVWVLDVALPALALKAMHEIVFPAGVGLVVAAPYLLFAVSTGCYLLLGKALRMRRDVVAALVATTAVANTSFVGIPMVTAFYGADAVPVAILVDQLGSFILLSTAVTVTVAVGADGRTAGAVGADGRTAGAVAGAGRVARNVVTFPPLLALLTGLALRPVELPAWLVDALAQLGATLTPVALFAVGLQLRVGAVRDWRAELPLGLAVKLVAGPAAVVGVYTVLLGTVADPAIQVALFETAMPPMVAGSIMATRYGLAGSLPSLLVGVGVPASMFTLPVWSWLLQR